MQRITLPTIATSPIAITSCIGCGVCCREQSLPPFLDEIDFAPIELQREVIEARKREADFEGKPCIWWEAATGKCRHHEHRPNICREYEVGGELCLEIREKYRVGIEKGSGGG